MQRSLRCLKKRNIEKKGANVGVGGEKGGLLKIVVSNFSSHVEVLLFLSKRKKERKKTS